MPSSVCTRVARATLVTLMAAIALCGAADAASGGQVRAAAATVQVEAGPVIADCASCGAGF